MRRLSGAAGFLCGMSLLLLILAGTQCRAEDVAAPPAKLAPTAKPVAVVKPAKPLPGHETKIAALRRKPAPRVVAWRHPTPQNRDVHPHSVVASRNSPSPVPTAASPSEPPASGIVRTALRAVPATAVRPSETRPLTAALPETSSVRVGEPPAGPPSASASGFVTAFLDDAFRIARSTANAPVQRYAELADLLTTRMDIGRILQYATRAEFQSASPAVQQQFRASFARFLAEGYSPRIELASGFSFVASPSHPTPAGAEMVSTAFSKPGYPAEQIDWTVERVGGGYRIVDVSSSGVSLLDIQRASFESVMQNGGLTALLVKLDARTRELASAAE
jgi:phospholipid transport system substrate-binding protein